MLLVSGRVSLAAAGEKKLTPLVKHPKQKDENRWHEVL